MALIYKASLNYATNPGDYVWCKYAATSGAFGTLSDLARKDDAAATAAGVIPVASTATPNGYFRFILVGYDRLGRKKFIADRNIQHTIAWNILNSAGVASGSGLPLTIDGVADIYTLRLPAGHVSASDTDHEWGRIIGQSNLNGAILPGDNSVWNWAGIYSMESSTYSSSGSRAVAGSTAADATQSRDVSSPANTIGFRPVLLVGRAPILLTPTKVTPTHVHSSTSPVTIDFIVDPRAENTVNQTFDSLTFDAADATKFDTNPYVAFDGKMYLKTAYTSSMNDKGVVGSGKMFSTTIPNAQLKTIESIKVV